MSRVRERIFLLPGIAVFVLSSLLLPTARAGEGTTVLEFTPTPISEDTASATPGAKQPIGSTIESTQPDATGPNPEDVFFQAYWEEGVKYRLLGKVKIVTWHPGEPILTREPLLIGTLGFRLMVDGAAFAKSDGLSGVSSGVKVRRSFLTIGGTFFNELWPIQYWLEFGAITSSFFFSEGYLMLTDLPYVGSLKVGQFTAPLSLDALISSRDRTFMESAGPVTAFSLGTRVGTQFADHNDEWRTAWAFGWFADGQDVDVGDASDSFARLVGRLAWVAHEDRDSLRPFLVHVGMATSYLFSGSGNVRYQSRPESFIAPIAVDTGDLDSDQAVVVGTEAAFVYGPVSGQFEYLHAIAVGGDTGTVNFPGVYFSLGSFLTGESRPYDRTIGRFGMIVPKHNLSISNRTWGALEYAGRYSFTSLDNGPVRGGKMNNLSLGFNWYWNRYVRWQFNYVFSDIDGGNLDGILNTFQMRFQLVM